ncbi:MAG: metallophosphoesterase [Rhizobacter sp.]|nr:metallophosphoesterase family protein [Burkholderiaceae bacterium]MCO5122217.1 metallophosphoesterase [Rhizobacter sp.]
MRIALLSDLHLSVHPMPAPAIDADVLVLAGDLHRPAAAIEWARQFEGMPTLFVAGNHDFYGGDLVTTLRELRRQAQGSSIHVLEHDVWCHQGVRFLGCTLWSDYRLYESPQQREQGLAQAQTMVRDFSRIRVAPDFEELFTPAVAQLLFDDAVAWLEAQFAIAHDGPTVVVTHFAPARGSIAPQFAGSPLNACFVSDLEASIQRWQPSLWLHGHVHDSFDYRIGATRVVANPRGYAPKGVVENKTFDPTLILSL